MHSKKSHKKTRAVEEHPTAGMDRRNQNRRKKCCEGYTYIPMVGWYCRREKARRNNHSQD